MKEPDGPDFHMSMLDLKDLRKNQDMEKNELYETAFN